MIDNTLDFIASLTLVAICALIPTAIIVIVYGLFNYIFPKQKDRGLSHRRRK